MTDRLEFVYVGDPMCSWCWGFAPVLTELQETYRIRLRTVVGGLRPGPDAEVLDDRLAGYLAHHWREVERVTGQPFDHAFLERRDGWRYDTELPALAVAAMRMMGGPDVVPFFTRLQQAFYAEGTDITRPSVYPQLAEESGVDGARFARMLDDGEVRVAAWEDFAEARRLGVSGFPTLLLRDGADLHVVTRGYLPARALLPALSDWLLGRFGEEASGLFCEPGSAC